MNDGAWMAEHDHAYQEWQEKFRAVGDALRAATDQGGVVVLGAGQLCDAAMARPDGVAWIRQHLKLDPLPPG